MYATRIYQDVALYVILVTYIMNDWKCKDHLWFLNLFKMHFLFKDITPKTELTTPIGGISVCKNDLPESVIQTSTHSQTANNGLEGM